MIRRRLIMKGWFYIVTALSVALTLYFIYNGQPNNIWTILRACGVALSIFMLVFVADRAVGNYAPIVIDLQHLKNLDRSDPTKIIIHTDEDIIITIVDEEVHRIMVGEYMKCRPDTNDYCYVQISPNRRVRIDSEYAYILYNILKDKGISLKKTGITYQSKRQAQHSNA